MQFSGISCVAALAVILWGVSQTNGLLCVHSCLSRMLLFGELWDLQLFHLFGLLFFSQACKVCAVASRLLGGLPLATVGFLSYTSLLFVFAFGLKPHVLVVFLG